MPDTVDDNYRGDSGVAVLLLVYHHIPISAVPASVASPIAPLSR